MMHALLDGIQTVLAGYAAGWVVALGGLLHSLWRGEVF